MNFNEWLCCKCGSGVKIHSLTLSFAFSLCSLSSVGRTLEDFKTSVTVAAHSKVTFELTYEELLSRRLGKYELLINAQPGQIVKDFKVRERPFSWVT